MNYAELKKISVPCIFGSILIGEDILSTSSVAVSPSLIVDSMSKGEDISIPVNSEPVFDDDDITPFQEDPATRWGFDIFDSYEETRKEAHRLKNPPATPTSATPTSIPSPSDSAPTSPSATE